MKPLREWIIDVFNQRPRKFLFRVDAGRIQGLSFGHLARCLILSKIFKELFCCENIFLMRNIDEGIQHALQSDEVVRCLPKFLKSIEEKNYVINNVKDLKPDWIIFDLPYSDLDTSYFSALRYEGVGIFFIDDFRFLNPGVDILLNSSILAKKKFLNSPNIFTKYLLGPQFFIFDESDNNTLPVRSDNLFNVVLTFGGADPTNLTKKVINALINKHWKQTIFRIILGPGYHEIKYVENLVKLYEKQFKIIVNPSSIFPYLKGADLVISAGGRTMYELVHINKDCLPIATTDIEAEAIDEFKRQSIINNGLLIWSEAYFVKILKNLLK